MLSASASATPPRFFVFCFSFYFNLQKYCAFALLFFKKNSGLCPQVLRLTQPPRARVTRDALS